MQIREPVRFRARLSRPLSRLFYEFRDEDGKVIESGIDQTEAEGRFSKPGPHVITVRVRIDGPPLTAWTTIQVHAALATATPWITPTPTITSPLEVYLSADKNPSSVGKTVTFSISTNKNKPYLYELNFGDNSRPFQTRSNSVWHIFKAPGKYIVSARVLDDRSRPSANLEIFVDGGTPPWIYVILVVLGVVALRYLLRRKPPPVPAQPPPIPALPTFHLHWDRDSPQKQQENVTVNYELHFDPNLSKGRQRLEIGGTSLIISKKKKQ